MDRTFSAPNHDTGSAAGAHVFRDGTNRLAVAHGWWTALHFAYVTVATALLTNVHFASNTRLDDGAIDGGFINTYEQVVVLAAGLAFLARDPARFLIGVRRLAPFLLLLALAIASAVWSAVPLIVLRRAGSLGSLMLFAIYLVSVPGTIRGWRVVIWTISTAAIASLIAAMVVPASAFDTGLNADALRGVFPQKNSLGDAMVVGLIAQSCLLLHRTRLRWRDLAFAALAFGLILLSRSVTSLALGLLVTSSTLIARAWVLRTRARSIVLLAGLGGALAASAALAMGFETLLGLFGKSANLTGRVGIWSIISSRVGSPSWLGAGYAAFWRPEAPTAVRIWRDIGFVTQNAHNGYLEVLLELGIVGLALIVILVALTASAAVEAMLRGRRGVAVWTAIVLLAALILNYDEATWPSPDMHLAQWLVAYLLCRDAVALAKAQAADAAPRRYSPYP